MLVSLIQENSIKIFHGKLVRQFHERSNIILPPIFYRGIAYSFNADQPSRKQIMTVLSSKSRWYIAFYVRFVHICWKTKKKKEKKRRGMLNPTDNTVALDYTCKYSILCSCIENRRWEGLNLDRRPINWCLA